MRLVDVKLPKKTKAELKTECQPIGYGDEDRWPYGLRIDFEKEQIAKMPEVAGLKVGDAVSISGIGKVLLSGYQSDAAARMIITLKFRLNKSAFLQKRISRI